MENFNLSVERTLAIRNIMQGIGLRVKVNTGHRAIYSVAGIQGKAKNYLGSMESKVYIGDTRSSSSLYEI